jgi:threonyl-tRNA synthetase
MSPLKQDQLDQEKSPLWKMRHTAEHVMHQAIKELFPDVHLAMGPATEEGFYCDFDASPDGKTAVKISEDDFSRIEQRMQELIAKDLPLIRQELSLTEARQIFAHNPYKLAWLDEIETKGEQVTVFWTGEPTQATSMVDLCAGPHAKSTGEIKAFKLLSVAGAYWRGSEKNKMLTRIYGTAFFSQAELDSFLQQRAEIEKRDHRRLGQELELFFIDEMVGKGLIMWLPKGTILRDQIEQLAKDKEAAAGYQRVSTPHIAKEELFLTSGHLPYYKDSMYPPMSMDDGNYYLKAMNCPHHHRIFGHRPRSYKELPLRLAEYGTCYRNELSGAVSGLLRVRGMTMNDAHIYCTREQIKSEFTAVLRLTMEYFAIFGLKEYWFRLSKWSPDHTDKYINEPANWEFSEQVLREVLQEMNVHFVEAEDEAAFYGPKVDVQFRSVVGREETMSTIQLDFLAKARFQLGYIDDTGQVNHEVFVIHRAPLSVHERFLAFIIEHYAGAFPTWLAPVQVALVPISDQQHSYAQEVAHTLKSHGIRVEVLKEAESMQNKIRKAAAQKVPYTLILGKKEVIEQAVSVRQRGNKDLGVMSVDTFAAKVTEEIVTKSSW